MVQILNETSLLDISLSTLAGLIITAVTLWLQQYQNIPKDAYVAGTFLPLLFTIIAAIGVIGMGGYYLWWRAMGIGRKSASGIIMK